MKPPYLTRLRRRVARGLLLAGLILCVVAASARAGTGGAAGG
jgi:hypothetical protein